MTPKRASGWSCGKLILSGEHSVVYNHPAIAVPVSLGVRVTLSKHNGPIELPEIDQRLTQAWKKVLPKEGVRVSVESDLPIGAGMGSSAALSIATLRALAKTYGHEATFDWLYEQGFVMERVFHGTPSGLDHAVCALQKPIRFVREGPSICEIALPQCTMVVMNSQEPKKTKEMVSKVRDNLSKNETILNQIGTLTQSIVDTPQCSLSWLGKKLTENHHLLCELGVSTPTLDMLVETAISHGAFGAKLAGAGGGGIAFALVDNPVPIQSVIEKMGYECFCLHTSIA